MEDIYRDLQKAYVGFSGYSKDYDKETKTFKLGIATGKWGCGVFKGNPELKFIIQWMAATKANRNIIFCSFKDDVFFQKAKEFVYHAENNKLNLETLMNILEKLSLNKNEKVFEFVLNELGCQKNSVDNMNLEIKSTVTIES